MQTKLNPGVVRRTIPGLVSSATQAKIYWENKFINKTLFPLNIALTAERFVKTFQSDLVRIVEFYFYADLHTRNCLQQFRIIIIITVLYFQTDLHVCNCNRTCNRTIALRIVLRIEFSIGCFSIGHLKGRQVDELIPEHGALCSHLLVGLLVGRAS